MVSVNVQDVTQQVKDLCEQKETLQERRLRQYDEAVARARAVFKRKNAEYGDAISKSGVLGAALELDGIAGRLHTVTLSHVITCREDLDELQSKVAVLPHRDLRNAIVLDKAIDAINFGVIILMMMDDENWTGK